MRVTVDVAGAGSHDVEVGPDGTYADLVEPLPYSPQEVTVLVDGQPVPADAAVEADSVEILRLIKGG